MIKEHLASKLAFLKEVAELDACARGNVPPELYPAMAALFQGDLEQLRDVLASHTGHTGTWKKKSYP